MPMSVVYTTVNGQILCENRGGVVSHFVSDPLGSVVMVRDNSGNTVYEAEYDPYGNVQSETGTNPSEFGYVGTVGYVKDSAFSLYVRARYLLTNLGRWLTKDPLWPSEPGYVYAGANPETRVDPDGLMPITIFPSLQNCWFGLGALFTRWYFSMVHICHHNYTHCMMCCLLSKMATPACAVALQHLQNLITGSPSTDRNRLGKCQFGTRAPCLTPCHSHCLSDPAIAKPNFDPRCVLSGTSYPRPPWPGLPFGMFDFL